MGLGGAGGAHLVEMDFTASGGGLQRGFRACEASADDFDLLHLSRIREDRAIAFGEPRQVSCLHRTALLVLKHNIRRIALNDRADPSRGKLKWQRWFQSIPIQVLR